MIRRIKTKRVLVHFDSVEDAEELAAAEFEASGMTYEEVAGLTLRTTPTVIKFLTGETMHPWLDTTLQVFGAVGIDMLADRRGQQSARTVRVHNVPPGGFSQTNRNYNGHYKAACKGR